MTSRQPEFESGLLIPRGEMLLLWQLQDLDTRINLTQESQGSSIPPFVPKRPWLVCLTGKLGLLHGLAKALALAQVLETKTFFLLMYNVHVIIVIQDALGFRVNKLWVSKKWPPNFPFKNIKGFHLWDFSVRCSTEATFGDHLIKMSFAVVWWDSCTVATALNVLLKHHLLHLQHHHHHHPHHHHQHCHCQLIAIVDKI